MIRIGSPVSLTALTNSAAGRACSPIAELTTAWRLIMRQSPVLGIGPRRPAFLSRDLSGTYAGAGPANARVAKLINCYDRRVRL
ncbi:hypothetical protein RSal33209_1581 [Renibacterium salmoninarum ATCC 33209]|uniref:Uncharacterized protein n=1 Tax=Renibacterium salmoninarum (strain ATCC 33209 / DSM 20767 / JCM 11484 / NBRC 15589 / NCIMB 2235) TaxID=288705 RepID=A9WMI4_RENSM|nr:hypothetical protein RSal33209_1581 [Renibacterium salmoninarum ATCC 33209]